MTDLDLDRLREAHAEAVRILRSDAVRVACLGGGAGEFLSKYIGALIDVQPALFDAAEAGVLLAEVEARWPHPRYDLDISRDEQPGPRWRVTVSDYSEEFARGEADTLAAALRELLK